MNRLFLTIAHFGIVFWMLVGCAIPPTTLPPTAVIPTPTTAPAITCTTVETLWGQDWEMAIEALVTLRMQGVDCGAEPLTSKLYAARFNYAALLEAQKDMQGAIAQLEAAYALDPGRAEAIDALDRLGRLPNPTPVQCDDPVPLIDDSPPVPAPPENPDITQFVSVTNTTLTLEGEPFSIRGVNYYPRHAPWHRFLEQATPAEMATELDLIQGAGLNTIRIFLRYDALFKCEPELAIANEAGFAIVDTVLLLAQERGLKVIVTLNDLPDLRFRPLYTDWERYDAQTIYIVRRYRDNPTILAWDLRNEGDLDYGARTGDIPRFTQDEVLSWLAHVSALVRDYDSNHLITAGWWGDPADTSPYVDFLSFHHWSNAEELAARIETYQKSANKPLLLQEVGYHSWAEAPVDARTEAAQATLLSQIVSVTDQTNLAGWMVWSAFDYVPEAGQPPNYEHFFGIWRTDGTPKPAVEILQVNQ